MSFDSLAKALADRYRIERDVGQGGMATVYLAQDLKHDRRVALKVLRPELAATLGSARFFREIQVAARLQHPHILPLHDSGEADGFLYYVMPFVEGESLRERLARAGELPIHDALKIVMEVVDALAYAHAQGVVHRDIKPDNVMLSGRHALVTDFGVAKAVSEATGKHQLTTAGVALGTPAYMAPEQAAADPHLDHRVDIYAVGAMAYELLTGRPPFTGMTAQQVLAAHVTQAPDPVSRHRAAVTPALEAVLMRCLAKRASDRWQSAEELLQNLEPLATPSGGMTPTQTRPVAAVTPGTSSLGRRALLGGALALLAVVGALGWLALGHRPARLVQPDRRQLTFTGNAWTSALSPDGQRIAYSTRHCTAEGYCTYDVVVQDVEGAGASTVLHGWASIWGIHWTDDARFLLINGFEGLTGHWGPFSVPSLGGGLPRFLGCCGGEVAEGDTALVERTLNGDAKMWIFRVSLADAVVHDSVAVAIDQGTGNNTGAWPLDHGRFFIPFPLLRGVRLAVYDRDGTLRDSVTLPDPRLDPASAEATHDGRTILIGRSEPNGLGGYDLLGFAVDPEGRIDPRADTLLRGMTGFFAAARNGMLVNATGEARSEVWLLRRDGPASMTFTQRRIASATAPLGGTLSPDGRRVLLWRRVVQGGEGLTQLSVMSADSGAETPLGPPAVVADYDWAQDGHAAIAALQHGDTTAIVELDVATGRPRTLFALPSTQFRSLWTLAGGGVAIRGPSWQRLDLRAIPGRPDTSLTIPDSAGTLIAAATSPDGRGLVTVGWDHSFDSIVVRRFDLRTGRVARLAAFFADGTQTPTWLDDRSILVQIKENASTLVWYRVPAAGGKPVRLGTPPRATDATLRLSRDGTRAIARVATTSPDAYIIRNFSELLRH